MSREQKVGWVKRSAAPPRERQTARWWGRASLDPPYFLLILTVLVLSLGCGTGAYDQKAAESDDSGDLHWPKVTISKETTYFTEPLRPDGGVDYVAALNRRCSEGVTPENNALIPLLRATGPKEIDKEIRKRYFQMLGIPELPEDGEYLIGVWELPEYKEAEKQSGDEYFLQKIWGQHSEAIKGPWAKQDYPFWATVLERNEKLLNTIADGLQRPRFYSPLVLKRDDENLIVGCDMTAGFDESRWVIRLLQPRAMLRLHEGDVAGTWQDIIAMYRLARLGSQRPFMSDWICMYVTLDKMASRSAIALSRHEGLSAAQARKYQKQLQSLPSGHSIGEICNEGERCTAIEGLVTLSNPETQKEYFDLEEMLLNMRKTTDTQYKNGDSGWKRRREACMKLIAANKVDWTEVFLQHNSYFDKLANACSSSQYTQALAELKTLESEVSLRSKRITDAVLSDKSPNVKDIDSKTQAQYIATLAILHEPLHNWQQLIFIEQRRQVLENMAMLTFALAGYRAEHDGKYPRTLGELVPTYIDVLPKDPFNDGDFHYRAEDSGYLLYSVGQNGKDDGGHGQGNYPDSATEEQRKEWDDISIRTPREKSN